MRLLNGPSSPGWLQTIKTIVRPWEYLNTCAQRYGDPFIVREQRSPDVIYFSHPQANKEIFTTDPELFDIGKGNEYVGFLIGEQSLLLLDSDRHKYKRRLLTPPFHGDRLSYYNRLTCEITKQVTKQLRVGRPFIVRLLIQEITLRLILQAVFGVCEGQRYEQLRQLLASIVDFTTTSPLGISLFFFRSLRQDWGPLSPWGHFRRQKQKLDQFRPERFLEREFSPYEYLPFGGGNRICLGMAFAKLEMKLVLATIMSHFQLALVDNREVLPVRHGPLIAPPAGMRMVVTSERPTNTLSLSLS